MNTRPQWEHILTLSQAMLSAARAEEWSAVTETEVARRGLMEAFFAHTVAATEADAVAAGIREVLAVDREVMALCQQAKDSVSLQMGAVAQGRRAQDAYEQNR